MENQGKYWFPTKTYGWGWGLPTCWQGWVVYAAYAGTMALTFYVAPPATNVVLFLACTAVSTTALVAVCWIKGEPPRWRWGDR